MRIDVQLAYILKVIQSNQFFKNDFQIGLISFQVVMGKNLIQEGIQQEISPKNIIFISSKQVQYS
ncbi:unnamed protein product [Paramecium octaurelia]|uniref:Uncharacterized protein n=1 Tax=Paramecium octaurelia TaxID=43137 RepID=A0A8S1V2F6_PAROT|nr:unnamed protein product [Paramecium octaurelia]